MKNNGPIIFIILTTLIDKNVTLQHKNFLIYNG